MFEELLAFVKHDEQNATQYEWLRDNASVIVD